MKNPATIPERVMQDFESRMAHAQSLQETRRHVVQHHGRAEWSWLSTTPHERHGRERRQAARSILEARRLIRENGFDVATVCAIARDPGKFAFCDGGGATTENICQ